VSDLRSSLQVPQLCGGLHGETEFVNGVAAMTASGAYGDNRVCAGIFGNADCTIGDAIKEVQEACIEAFVPSLCDCTSSMNGIPGMMVAVSRFNDRWEAVMLVRDRFHRRTLPCKVARRNPNPANTSITGLQRTLPVILTAPSRGSAVFRRQQGHRQAFRVPRVSARDGAGRCRSNFAT
jgi:hypothetical protein